MLAVKNVRELAELQVQRNDNVIQRSHHCIGENNCCQGVDSPVPMEIGMTAKEDGESASQEGDQRIVDLALQAVYIGTVKGKWRFGKGQNWNE